MRFYRVNEDWITHLEGAFRGDLLETLRSLSFDRLQKYPPPKISGLPFGNEHRVMARFLKRQSSQLDASALSGFYRSMMSAADKLMYKAFRTNESLSEAEWAKLIGVDNVEKWITNKCLIRNPNGSIWCQFSVVALDGILLCIDPLKDHGRTWEPSFIVEEAPDEFGEVMPFFHTYIGLDTLRMIEEMERVRLPDGGRYLDCGPGAGGLLLYFGRRFEDAVGIDINPRAAKLAHFNADLNKLANCSTFEDDAILVGDKYGKFDLVSWNLPFIFMPDNYEDELIDGFGGEFGIGLCLKFIEAVPQLLAESGLACIAALAPILDNGTNVLENRLKEKLGRLGLDCKLKVAQISIAPNRELWRFHRSHDIAKFEAVYLFLNAGSGKWDRIQTSASRKLIDRVRVSAYTRRFA